MGSRRLVTSLGLAALLLSASACINEITADLKVDGEVFEPTSCRSGQRNNFAGVDLIDAGGRILRLAQSLANQPQAILIAGAQIVEVGACGSMAVQRQSSTINDITNVMGEAVLDCAAAGHSVAGSVSFKNCH